MEQEKVLLTQEGFDKCKEELDYLVNVARPQVTKEIGEAAALGDKSENADYDAARAKQGEIEARIIQLQYAINHAEIIRSSGLKNVVTVGSTVELLSLDENVTDTYTIVGTAEANPMQGKISNECLLAQAVLNHKVGEEVLVKVDVPYSVRILSIK